MLGTSVRCGRIDDSMTSSLAPLLRAIAGLPGLAIPVGLDSAGLPLGLQLIGRPWDEGNLLNHGAVLEKAAGFVAKPDRWW